MLVSVLLAASGAVACTAGEGVVEGAPVAEAVAVRATPPVSPPVLAPRLASGPAGGAHVAPPVELSAGERRAILDARKKRGAPAVAPPVASDELVVEAAPKVEGGVGALKPGDVAALADDPAAGRLPEVRPRSALVQREAAPGDVGQPGAPSPEAPREAAPETPTGPGQVLRPGVEAWSGDGLRVLDLAIATAVEARQPVGVARRYRDVPSLLMCYSSFGSDDDTTVTHVWRHDDRVVSKVELSVGRSPSWRTWSRQRLTSDGAGAWSCEVLGEDGRTVGLARVQVGPLP